jgi:uncharacterized LabA/DUF88 family protein
MNAPKTAILIDGGFFLKRYSVLFGRDHTPQMVAKKLWEMAIQHLGKDSERLYRIYYYDCKPFEKRVHNPISGKVVVFDKTPLAESRRELFEELKKKRKVALRLGVLKDTKHWQIRPDKTKLLLSGAIQVSDLTADDVVYEIRQKTVDMKIGLDIATLAHKNLVDQIVLVSLCPRPN